MVPIAADSGDMPDIKDVSARLATLDRLRETTVAVYLDPVPSRDTVREMLDKAGIPRFKANPTAKRGGGLVYYSVSAVEKLLRARTLPAGAMVRARGPVVC